MRLRIALVTPYSLDVPGGVGTHVLGLAHWLLSEGHAPVVIAPGEAATERGVPVRLLGPSSAFRFNGSVARLAVAPDQARRAAAAVAGADVVHVHEPLTPGATYAAARAAGPLVVTHHAAFSPGLLGPLLRRRARRLPASRISVAVSEAAAVTARVATGVDPLIIPNAIAMPAQAKSAVGSRPTVAFVGRLDEPRKGYPLFCDLARSMPEARFVAIGPGGRGADGVTELGVLDDVAASAVLSEASVLVAPNLFGESFGVIILEGLAHGCAIVASDLPAFRAVADHPDATSWFPIGDPVSARAAIRRRLEHPVEPSVARSLAARYSWERVGPEILEVYRLAITAWPGR